MKYNTTAGANWLQRARSELKEQNLETAVIKNLVKYTAYAIYSLYPETELGPCAPLREPLSKELELVPQQASEPLAKGVEEKLRAMPMAGEWFLDLKHWIQAQQPQPPAASEPVPAPVPVPVNYLVVQREPLDLQPGQVLATQEAMERFKSETWSYSLWVQVLQLPPSGYIGLLGKSSANLEFSVMFRSDGKHAFQGGWTSSTVTVGEWTHLVAVQSPGKFTAYANGVVDQALDKAAVAWKAAPLVSGMDNYPCNNGHARIADLRFYNRALTAQEVQAIGKEAKITGSTFELPGSAPKPQKSSSPQKSPSSPDPQDQEAEALELIETVVFYLQGNYPAAAAALARKLKEHGLDDALDEYFPEFAEEPHPVPSSMGSPGQAASSTDPMDQAVKELTRFMGTMDFGEAPAPQVQSVDELFAQVKDQKEQITSALEVLRERRPAVASKVERTLSEQVTKADRSCRTVTEELLKLGGISQQFRQIQNLLQPLQQ